MVAYRPIVNCPWPRLSPKGPVSLLLSKARVSFAQLPMPTEAHLAPPILLAIQPGAGNLPKAIGPGVHRLQRLRARIAHRAVLIRARRIGSDPMTAQALAA